MAGGGSQPGERRGGRRKGTPNKATAEIRALAMGYGPQAFQELAKLGGLARMTRASPLPELKARRRVSRRSGC